MNQYYLKIIFNIAFLSISIISFSQTSIAKKNVENEDVILDFRPGETRGIILPWVTNESNVLSPVGGTMIFDSNDKKIKYYRSGSDPRWVDISINTGNVDTSIQSGLQETNKKTIIGSKTTTSNGVLVLESSNKAMVLPKVTSPHLNIIRPAAGTVVYDNVSKMMCLFNGTEWSFWKIP